MSFTSTIIGDNYSSASLGTLTFMTSPFHDSVYFKKEKASLPFRTEDTDDL